MPENWGNRPWTVAHVPAHRELPRTLDFAVVGGGFTGLTAAAWFKTIAPEKSVAVFEAETLGAGASGHTGGIALSESAVGNLPGLGDVLVGYREILRELDVEADLTLPGVYELGRKNAMKNSPIHWKDPGGLFVVKEVSGGSIDPGKVINGLARAVERLGGLLLENAAVQDMKFAKDIELHTAAGVTSIKKLLFATNAYALELSGLQGRAKSAFTTAVMTEPLREEVLKQIGLNERKPFYTVDLPYLWGRLMGDAVIFGSGLVFAENWRQLYDLDIDKGEAREVFARLEKRIAKLHPSLKAVKFTHRWGGPICIAEGWTPVFEHHPKSKNAIVLGGYSGHGVAQSVYLGAWAAEASLDRRKLPAWK
jgi:glycine/D-amino acid oxidase-like deaminating enzyme